MKQAEILMTNLYVRPNNSLYFNVKAGQNVTHQIYSKILGMNFKSYTIIIVKYFSFEILIFSYTSTFKQSSSS